MSSPPTFDLFGNAISSPESRAGHMRSTSPAGEIAKCGPEAVPVSRFRAQDSGEAMPTSDTSGPLFTVSSPSAALQRSLESRLRAVMDVNGSPEYALTWKSWDMPSGAPICALRARARPISDSACSGWPTPMASDVRDGIGGVNDAHRTIRRLETIAQLAGWPTPTPWAAVNPRAVSTGVTLDKLSLGAVASAAATPTTRDHKDGAMARWPTTRPINGLLGTASHWLPCLDGKARRIEPGTFAAG